MTHSRRNFLRDSAQMLTAVPLLGAAAPLLGADVPSPDAAPPVGIDYSLLTRPFVGKKVSAKYITVKDIGGLTLFAGAGCNVVAVAGPRGALLIDGGLAVNSALLLKAVHGKLGTRRIDTLVNTHWHPEQIGLNEAAGRDGATIVSHEVTRLCTGRKLRSPQFDGTIGPLPDAARPKQTTYDQYVFEFAGEEVQCRHLPGAHTGGDLCVYFPKRNVLVAGGPVTSDRWPVIDYINGGFMHGFVRSYDLLSALVKPDTLVVPANGPVMTGADVVRMKDLYWQLFKQFFVLFNKGLGPRDVAEFNVGKEFKGVVPIVADRPLVGNSILQQLGDPKQFLEFAYRSAQLATLPF
jgi:glyoxylase-like metal-dependent hydrolase (beta-lactamase superfamily II)